MYLSPAVRTIRDDPTPGVEVTLVVRPGDAGTESVLTAVRAGDGQLAKETQFDNLHVTIDEPAVADLLDGLPDGVAAVETVTSTLSGDAGEDRDPDGDAR